MNNYERTKEILKNQPFTIFRYPWLLRYVPKIVFKTVATRLVNKKTVVFVIENNIEEILQKLKLQNEIGEFLVINDYSEFHDLALKRINDDPNIGYNYINICRKRFQEGDFVTVLKINDRVVSYSFVSEKKLFAPPVNINLLLPSGTFCYYDVYTYKDFQGKGYYKKVYLDTLKFMKNKGYDKIWGMVMEHNQVSVKVHCNIYLNKITRKLIEEIKYGFIRRYVENIDLDLNFFIHRNE